MPHTNSRYQQALGFTDGIINLTPLDAVNTGDAAAATRNDVGDVSWNVVNAKAPVFTFNIGEGQIFRSGFTDVDLQEQFGGTYSPDAQAQGYPPFAGAGYLTPRTALRVKGLKLLSVAVCYLVGTNNLASFTARMDKSIFVNNVALASSSLLAVANNGLPLVAQANPYVFEIALPAASQVYQITDLSQIWLELAPTSGAAGGSTFRLYWVRVKVEFNFN